jgi:regulation of enolase protein 1 (concanavalin A-like superfamily)
MGYAIFGVTTRTKKRKEIIMKQFIVVSLILIISLSGCSGGAEAPPTSPPPQPTDTSPPPTEIPEPSATPEPTATPDPILFLDEFDGGLDPAWSWLNEDPGRWSVTEDGWLGLQAANQGFQAGDEGAINQVNMLLQPAPEGDIVLTTHIFAQPDENFNQAGIFLIHDGNNYVNITMGFCEFCLPDTGGYGFYMDPILGGEFIQGENRAERADTVTEAYLRLVYSAPENKATGYYALEPDGWVELNSIEGLPPIEQLGLGAANLPGPDGVQEDLLAYYDYVEVASQETPTRAGSALPKPPPTPEPTEIPEPTPLPEGLLFRDDFEGYLQPGWTWVNENPEKWGFVEFAGSTWLQIFGDKPGGLAEQRNTLSRALPEGNFVLTSHVAANPRQNHHQANIFIYQDETNFIRLNFGFCDHCGLPEGGYGYFMETIIDNNPFGDFYAVPRSAEDTDVYLRLVNQGGSITGYYALEYGDWQKIGAFGNYFDFVSVGLGATNSVPEEWEVEDIEALFDYFEIALP